MLIIDSHCHFGKGDGLIGPWDTAAPLENYTKWAKEAGIQKTVLFAAFNSNYSKANFEVYKKVKTNRNQFFGYAFLDAARDKGRIFSMVKTAVQKYKFKGLKLHRHDAHITREICETAQAFNLPVLYDVLGKVETVELFASQYPKVNFIIPHLGSFAGDWKAQLAFIPIMERHPNVFTDTSGVRRFDLLQMAVKRAGAHKFLFGSDGPWLHPGVELEKVFALNLSQKETELMCSGNFLRLIKNIRIHPKPFTTKEISNNFTIPQPHKEVEDPWLVGSKRK